MLRTDALKIDPLPPLSFSVARGECLAIEGPSGCGKTRLLRAIADLDRARGQVSLDGAERHDMPAHIWRRSVRYVTSEPAWWGETARSAFPLSTPGITDKLSRLCAALALDPRSIDLPLAQLSRGERHRWAFVRAVLDEPAVLLLDQPTLGLDPHSTALVEDLIRANILAGRIVLISGTDSGACDRLAHTRLQLARPRALRQAVAS